MELFNKFSLTNKQIWKGAGIVLLVIIVVAVGVRLIGSSIDPLIRHSGESIAYQTDGGYGGKMAPAYEESAADLSVRNILTAPGIPSPNSGSVGGDAEEFEITEYSVSIETGNLNRTCTEITDLKPLEYVIFENANEYDRGCSYTFKVEHGHVEEVLAIIESLHPENVSENIRTIKQTLDDYTSEIEILENKLETINETMNDAVVAYESITALATRNQDAESLAKIIDSKINVIERLTRERIDITAQLDRLQRSKLEQLDRLEYTYFYVNVLESKIINGDNLGDSWKEALRSTIYDINRAIQDVTVHLIATLFIALQYVVYILILLIVVKYGWKIVKRIWKK